jgi:hypothetical protein
MDQTEFAWLLVIAFVLLVALVTVVSVRYSRKKRQRCTDALQSYTRVRGWQATTNSNASIVPHSLRGPYFYGNVKGKHAGFSAELVITHVYKWKEATLVAVACSRATQGFQDGVVAMDPADQYAYGTDVGPAELAKRFRFTGKTNELMVLFAPPVQEAISSFPRHIHQIMFYDKTASITWLGWETDATIIDQALDTAQAMCRQVEAMGSGG